MVPNQSNNTANFQGTFSTFARNNGDTLHNCPEPEPHIPGGQKYVARYALVLVNLGPFFPCLLEFKGEYTHFLST